MSTTYAQAMAKRGDAFDAIAEATGQKPSKVSVAPDLDGWAVHVAIGEHPNGPVPTEVDGVAIILELSSSVVLL